MNKLANSFRNAPDARTHNNALSYRGTGSAVLDFFSKSGAMRAWDKDRVIQAWEYAWAEDPRLALAALFYARDIRGGQGERRLLRVILPRLATQYPTVVERNLTAVPEYGRWDDLFCLQNTPVWPAVLTFIGYQFGEDWLQYNAGRPISLLAKWLPTEKTTKGRHLARHLAYEMALSPRQYRHRVAALRKHLRVVERNMSLGKWQDIDYSGVPSQAARIYRKAFARHDPRGYADFLTAVESGEKTIKARAATPVDLLRSYRPYPGQPINRLDRTLEAQWEALPGTGRRSILSVIDVSGSMNSSGYYGEPGRSQRNNIPPIDVAVGLGLWAATHNQGAFSGLWLTFSRRPQIQKTGATLMESYNNAIRAHWDMNTDLQAALDLILNHAVRYDALADLPEMLLIISDMQFDSAGLGKTNLERAREKFAAHGVAMPTVVFWNVDAYSDTPARMHSSGVVLVSGYSAAIVESMLEGVESLLDLTPYNLMLRVLESPRYARLVI